MAASNQFIFEALIKVELPDTPLDYLELRDVIQITISAIENHEKSLERIRGGIEFLKSNYMWKWDIEMDPGRKPISMKLVNSILEQISTELGYKEYSTVLLFQPAQLIVKERHCFEKIFNI